MPSTVTIVSTITCLRIAARPRAAGLIDLCWIFKKPFFPSAIVSVHQLVAWLVSTKHITCAPCQLATHPTVNIWIPELTSSIQWSLIKSIDSQLLEVVTEPVIAKQNCGGYDGYDSKFSEEIVAFSWIATSATEIRKERKSVRPDSPSPHLNLKQNN